MTIGQNIRAVILANGKTEKEVCVAIGLTQLEFDKFINDKPKNSHILFKIADLLDMDFEMFANYIYKDVEKDYKMPTIRKNEPMHFGEVIQQSMADVFYIDSILQHKPDLTINKGRSIELAVQIYGIIHQRK